MPSQHRLPACRRAYATTDALRVNIDQVLALEAGCNSELMNELRAIGGIRTVSCLGSALLTADRFGSVDLKDGTNTTLAYVPIDSETLNVYGVHARAGRLFLKDRGDDERGEQKLPR